MNFFSQLRILFEVELTCNWAQALALPSCACCYGTNLTVSCDLCVRIKYLFLMPLMYLFKLISENSLHDTQPELVMLNLLFNIYIEFMYIIIIICHLADRV